MIVSRELSAPAFIKTEKRNREKRKSTFSTLGRFGVASISGFWDASASPQVTSRNTGYQKQRSIMLRRATRSRVSDSKATVAWKFERAPRPICHDNHLIATLVLKLVTIGESVVLYVLPSWPKFRRRSATCLLGRNFADGLLLPRALIFLLQASLPLTTPRRGPGPVLWLRGFSSPKAQLLGVHGYRSIWPPPLAVSSTSRGSRRLVVCSGPCR
jgi:hypothetical protein